MIENRSFNLGKFYVKMEKTNRNLQNYKERIHIMEGRLIAFVIWVIIGVLFIVMGIYCLLYTSPSPRDPKTSRMPSSA